MIMSTKEDIVHDLNEIQAEENQTAIQKQPPVQKINFSEQAC